MARIPGVEMEDAPAEVQEVFRRHEEGFGFVLNTARIVARFPAWLKATAPLSAALDEARHVSPELVSIVRVRVAQINGCPF